MANPNPTRRGDPRKIEHPHLRTRDVLIWIYDERLSEVIGTDVAEQFDLKWSAEGHSRLATLKKWGCLRIKERGRGRNPYVYETTAWGEKMAKKWKEE
ncbi:MAG: hypothetical protein ABIG95_02665 [Candidatus Woesearchaeota archaeon]